MYRARAAAALQLNQAKASNFQASLKWVMQTNAATKLQHVVSSPRYLRSS
jgi:hypothetical protein